MLIQTVGNAAKPGSQHAKFLPVIRESIAKANPWKLLENCMWCTTSVKIPTMDDVRRRENCTLDDAEKNGLFHKEGVEHTRRAFAENFSDRLIMYGTDGFVYQVDNEDKPPKVYALVIEGKQLTEDLWRGLGRANKLDGFQAAQKRMLQILNEETPTFEVSSGTHLHTIDFNDLAAVLPPDRQSMWIDIGNALKQIIQARGYRASSIISTPQDHALGGSTIWIGYFEQPYKPLGIMHTEMGEKGKDLGQLGVEETRLARELDVFTAVHHKYYGLQTDGKQLPIFFEPLDEKGNTVRDPRAIDTVRLGEFLKEYPLEDAIEKCLIQNVVKSSDFPNRRN